MPIRPKPNTPLYAVQNLSNALNRADFLHDFFLYIKQLKNILLLSLGGKPFPVEPVMTSFGTLAALFTLEKITETVFGGVMEKAAFEALPAYIKKLLPLTMSEPPVNHDLQKAILSAHWMATWVITDGLQKQAEKHRKNEAAHKVVINAAKDQLKKLKDENYLTITTPDAYEASELILKDPMLKSVTTLKASVIEFHLAEMRTHSGRAHELIAYEEIEEAIRNGQPDWFDLVCAFLNELLKGENNKAKDAFQNQEIAKMTIATGMLMQKMEEYSSNCISRIGEEKFEHFKEMVSLELRAIQISLTRIEDYLIEVIDKVDTLLVLHSKSRQESKELNLDNFPDFKQISNDIEALNLNFESKQLERQEVEEFLAEETNERKRQRYERELSELNQELLIIDEQRNRKKTTLVEFRSYIEKTWLSLYSTEVSPRLLQAREKFEQGDLTAANSILNPDLLEYEYEQLQQVSALVNQKKESLSQEYLAKANFTILEKADTNWFDAAKEYYQKAIQLQETFETYFAFADFLAGHQQFREAIKSYQKVLIYATSEDSETLAGTLNNLALLQKATNDFSKAEKNYLEALQIRRRLAESNPAAYEADVATTLNNLASLQKATNDFSKAEKNYLEALQIRRRLAESNPAAYEADVATTLNNLALLQKATNDFSTAEKNFLEALQITRRLAESNPAAYEAYVANTLNNLASLQQATNDFSKAEKNYLEALQIRRRLAESNPAAYEASVALTLNNLASLQKATNDFSTAEKNYLEALQIRRRLAESNPAAYEADVANILSNLASLQKATNDFSKAEKNYLEALQITRRLAESNPAAYEAYVALTLSNLASLQKATNDFSTAEKNFLEALQIYRRLAETNFKLYQVSLAINQINLSILYHSHLTNKDLSLQLAYEATINVAPLCQTLPLAMQIYQLGFQVWEAWGEDLNKYMENNH
ncbi:tetratricopeptide repeat protein [Runella zeae]|uniref:tetratricopeptide repeat protein n=1 Tax=Runella zeae TaxID=94255 RepID=UPI00235486B0|nr:tetratricopeptide repeat protein [Runella zeae]